MLKSIKFLAKKYIWWKTSCRPERVIAQVMNLGDFDDVQGLLKTVGEKKCRDVILHAEAGLFSPKSWSYWHYRLGLCKAGDKIPHMPRRVIE